ncbi:unnamed protein product [Boreogadus saida]
MPRTAAGLKELSVADSSLGLKSHRLPGLAASVSQGRPHSRCHRCTLGPTLLKFDEEQAVVVGGVGERG